MATRDFSKYFLYRWRYVIGYTAIGLLLAGLLLFAGLYLPGGLNEFEKTSVIRSASLSFSDPQTLAISNLPYHFFQAGIFALFGVSVLTIKLPSLILALLSAVGLVLLLRRWFKPNIAVITSLIAITTGQFLYIAQVGGPAILYVFWPIVLLLLGTQITRVKKFRFLWKILFAVAAALSLYTPLSIFPLLAIALSLVFHPHLRAVIRRLSRYRLAVVAGIFALGIAPLIWLMAVNPTLLRILTVGNPETWPPDLMANALEVSRQYLLFWHSSTTEVMTPVFGLGSALLITLGFYRLVRTRETTRSYLIIFWITCLIPVLLLNPGFTTVTFIPSVLMLAAGFTSLISYWYRLFPYNPYARITGLVPIVILVGALILTGTSRYLYGYYYNPAVVPLFSKDLSLLPDNTEQLVASSSERAFYEAVAKYRDELEIVTKPTHKSFTVTREARAGFTNYKITRIVTSASSSEADRFYVMRRAD